MKLNLIKTPGSSKWLIYMIKKPILLVLLIQTCWINSSAGQNTNAVPDNIRSMNTLDRLSDGGISTSELLLGIPVPPGEVLGDFYLNKDWKKTTIQTSKPDKLIEGYLCKFNIYTNQIEVKTKTSVTAIDGAKVKSFVWLDTENQTPEYFINANEYNAKESRLEGFLKVLFDGDLPLFKQTTLVVRQPDYKPEFHMGDRNTKIIKKDVYYYLHENELIEVKNNKKKFLAIFGEFSEEINKFIKTNSLNLNDEIAKIMVFEYYNNHLIETH